MQRKAVANVEHGKARTLEDAVNKIKGLPPTAPAKICAELDGLIEQMGRAADRDLDCEALKAALALLRRLCSVSAVAWRGTCELPVNPNR